MAYESVSVTPGTGKDVAVDTVDGKEIQVVKLDGGTDGASTPIEGGGGLEAGALRVTIASDSTGVISIDDNGGAITVDGTVNLGATDTGYLSAIKAAVEILDNIVSGSEAQVDVATVPAPLNVVGGGTEAAALRVTIANNSTGVITIDDGGSTISVDGTVTANLGATDNGVLDAIQTASEACKTALEGTLTVSGTVTANLSATDNAVLDTIATNTGAALTDTELRATPVPVSGTVTANLGTTDTGYLSAIKTAIEILDNIVSGSEAQVDIASALPAGDNNIGNVDIASITAGETHIGEVGLPDDTITITCSLDTSAYADGDVLFATQEIANAVRNNGDTCILQSVHVVDIDDQGVEMDLVFFNANTSLGTENSAPDIDDTEVLTTLGTVNVPDWIDLGANQIATVTGIGLLLEAGAATTSLYVAGITRGAPTHSASGLQITFGFLRN